MVNFTSPLYAKMTEELEQIAIESTNVLQMAKRSYRVVNNTLKELKKFIIQYDFVDDNEEIEFFKEIKPMFLKELIYYHEVYEFEKWKPPVGREEEIAHYGLGAKKVDFYLKRHNEIYTYYRQSSAERDAFYFLRNADKSDMISAVCLSDLDCRFSTPHSFEFAKLQAYEKFSGYLHKAIYRLEHPDTEPPQDEGRQVTWTDSNADLIELAYAIRARGSLNKGKAQIKDIICALERAFNIRLGNFYIVFQQNIRLRKKSRTVYMDQAKEFLVRYMDELDANPKANLF